jgi:hypothetical protein
VVGVWGTLRLAGEDRREQTGTPYAAREHADVVERSRKLEHAFGRYAAHGRLEADDAAERGRADDGAVRLRADRRGHDASRDRGR